MLSVTRLLCDVRTPGDDLRYGEKKPDNPNPAPVHRRPIVVWNVTRSCNLHCAHCYASSHDETYPGELTTDQAHAVIDDLADYGIPVLLFSGGEPLRRFDLPVLVKHAADRGLRPTLSSNGTLMTPEMARTLADAGMVRAGISLDGLEKVNDKFRGSKGAFQAALEGIRNAMAVGMRVSLRFTMTKQNVADLPGLFDLAESEGIPRVCIYHLAYAGRGEKLLTFDLDDTQRRKAVEFVFERTIKSHETGHDLEVLTVDNHADGPALAMWSRDNVPDRADDIERLLLKNGGNAAGKGIASIDNLGNVHPDQFWWTRNLGNVLEQPFSGIWSDENNEFLQQLRNRKALLPERCRNCTWLDSCNGNLRVRGESATGDPFGMDPACYLTDFEVFQPIAVS
ncbi:MAG: radical SAM protein [Chloroflexi bacterium]|nr:radical SAM protein [Chloroflexota bacterium]